jgi:hypothetical protein
MRRNGYGGGMAAAGVVLVLILLPLLPLTLPLTLPVIAFVRIRDARERRAELRAVPGV